MVIFVTMDMIAMAFYGLCSTCSLFCLDVVYLRICLYRLEFSA
jgi:hypothetical protein